MNEQEQINNCMNNSYTILTGKKSLSEILCEDDSSYFLWNVLDKELLKLKKTDEGKHRRKIREINTVG